jgi:hypothetical protein
VCSIYFYWIQLKDTDVRANLSVSTVTVSRQERYGQGFHWVIGVIYTENISRQDRDVIELGRPGISGEPMWGCLGVHSALVCTNVFAYGQKSAADQMRISYEKLAQYV